ncbi:acyltransferase [Aquabacterium sp.]|uniref:acyltransferase family protein n=1 Tax=Aquabacterium sp. TaxID=1872578 RepID=UPI002488796A|nr:acyltransferase [Aquabacterium sp.]MDI1259333.1 acyltransferase [Aquabacterium sp.]
MSPLPPAAGSTVLGSPSRAVDADALASALMAPRIAGLDFLRALAVALVLLGHSAESVASLADLLGVVSGLGVKVFFVLSGFLITRLLFDELDTHGRVDFRAFYRRRLARLMPAFYLYLVVAIGILWVRGKPIPWAAVTASMLYVTNYYQAFTGAQTNIVAHCWSLAVEEQFYMLWPLLAAFLVRRRLSMVRALVMIIVAVWCWRLFLTLQVQASVDYIYRALDTRADELAVGCLIAALFRDSKWRERLAVIMQLPLIGPVLVLLIYASTVMDGQSAVFKYCVGYMVEPILIGLLMILTVLAASRTTGWLAAVLNHRVLVHMGQVSYGMYLFHGMIMFTIQHAVEGRTDNFWLGFASAFVAVFAFSSAVFRWYETPMRRLINGH